MTTDPVSEDELVPAALQGDQLALQKLILMRYDWLAGHIGKQIPRHLRGSVCVEDLLHETYVKVFRSIGGARFADKARLLAWIQTIANNVLIDAMRRRNRDRTLTEGPSDEELSRFLDQIATADDPRVSAVARKGELVRAFRVAMAKLSEEYQQVIQLLYIQERPINEVAEAVGRSTDAVRGISHRARKKLRESLLRLSRFV